MSAAERIFSWLLALGRACVGGVMVYSGVELLRGEGLLSHSQFDSVITAIFVILLGVYCIFSGVLGRLVASMRRRQSGGKRL